VRVRFDIEVATPKDGEAPEDLFAPAELFSKSIELFGGLPRPGDLVNLTDGGWSEEVARVWWNLDETPISYLVEFRRVTDTQLEGLAEALREQGWKQS
jgi:hypothetical protein